MKARLNAGNFLTQIVNTESEGKLDSSLIVENQYTGPTLIVSHLQKPPSGYLLKQNYPNPFNDQTTIEYSLPFASYVIIEIYSTVGKMIRRLVDEIQPAGVYKLNWNGKSSAFENVPSGIYLYTIKANYFVGSGKMTLLR